MVHAMLVRLAKHLVLTLKYTYQDPSGTWYWQRRPPKDLRPRYPKGSIKVKLGPPDTPPAVLAEKVARLNAQHEAHWRAMLKAPALPPIATLGAAGQLLAAYGIDPLKLDAHEEGSEEALYDTLDAKREAYANRQHDPEEAYRSASLEDYLAPHEVEALERLAPVRAARQSPDVRKAGRVRLLSDVLAVYLEEGKGAGKEDWESFARARWGELMAHAGDMLFADFDRDRAKAYRDHLLASGLATGTVRRYLASIAAAFNVAMREWRLKEVSPWEDLGIKLEGKDAKKKTGLLPEDCQALRSLCYQQDDDIRWLLALQIDLGTRIAEPAGLALSDFRLDHETPHVLIQPHDWRTLKTGERSRREVPLVGAALWAARRIVETAKPGQLYAFPRYMRSGKCVSDSASAAINKWLRERVPGKTSHDFRHTMATRLRDSGAPRDVIETVCGWGALPQSDQYGLPYGLRLLAYYLRRTLPGAVEEAPPALPVAPL